MVQIPHNRAEAKGTEFEAIYRTPAHWPDDVHILTLENMDKLGIRERTSELLWDGQPIVTEKRFATQERVIAWVGVALAAIGVVATCVQAWFAAFPPVHP